MPHPPLLIPEVGKGELETIKDTVTAMDQAAQRIRSCNPQTVIVITPHGAVFREAVTISVHPRLRGTFANFGAPEVVLAFETDGLLSRAIIKKAERLGIDLVEFTDEAAKAYRMPLQLDHGTLVPLYYLHKAGFHGQLVHISLGPLPYEEIYTFGKAVQAAIAAVDKRVAVVASGDLSHRLLPGAPSGYSPRAQEFDRLLLSAARELNVKALLNLEQELIQEAGECALRPVYCLMGILGGLQAEAEVLSYEGPFGVGYGVVSITLPAMAEKKRGGDGMELQQQPSSPQVELARESLCHYLEHGRPLAAPDDVSPEMERAAGVFVSLKKRGELRGCIGTFRPARETIAAEIIANAVSAGTRDPRFFPVALGELPELDISVDVLEEPEPIASLAELEPQKYGVIVRSGSRSGLLLPMLEGVDSVEQQVAIARQKAGIGEDEAVELYRFTVTRYT